MRLGLGNNLVKTAFPIGTSPSLDLAFALDKTLTPRKGPKPAFTRSSTATFIGSDRLIQSAAIDEPRFDHDPETGVCKGLLIEEPRTNLVFPSDVLTTQTRTVTAVAHTLSFYGAGTVILSGAHTATVTGTGAFPTRTVLTFTPTAGILTLTVTGSVTQAQVEAGAFPTSYIPTTSGTAARSADVCSITGADFSSFYNQSEGSFAASVFFNAPVTYTVGQIVFDVNDTTSLNRLRIVRGAPSGVLYYSNTVSAVQDVSIVGPTSISASNITKIAGCMKTNDFAVYLDSTLQGTDTSAIMQASPTTFTIGEVSVGAATKAPLNGHIARIQYFRKRLSDAKLQTLTTP